MVRTSFFPAAILAALACVASAPCLAQTNPDWETLWVRQQPSTSNGPYGWMASRDRNYTGMAYDRFRDVLYVVNPDVDTVTGTAVAHPRIHIWHAATGAIADTVGRSLTGGGGEIAVPVDTVQGGFMRGRFCVYKVDVDDEGRIYACNLVNPLMNPIVPCPPDPYNQGPWRVYRWDDPHAAPRCIYSTLNKFHNGPAGSLYNTEMTHSRYGDAFEVVGMRGYETQASGPPLLVDSARIFVSGGSFCHQDETNREIEVFLEDRRANRPFDFRLAIKLVSSLEGISSHGIAPTGVGANAALWTDNAFRVTTLNNQGQDTSTWPQTLAMTSNYALSHDSASATGPSAALVFFEHRTINRSYLALADGHPTNIHDDNAQNYNTTARILDITDPTYPVRCGASTPQLGYRPQAIHAITDGLYNYITDLDVKLEYDARDSLYVTLFVLMSNNGIAAYRMRHPLRIPVDLVAFTAALEEDRVALRWETASECNNAGFDVQRSLTGGASWDVVGFVPGFGTVSAPRRYAFLDPVSPAHRAAGIARYRLRQIDTDGAASLSPVVDVVVDVVVGAAARDCVLLPPYPHPAAGDDVTLSWHQVRDGAATLAIYSCAGELLRTLSQGRYAAGTHRVVLDGGALPSGVYVVRLTVDGRTMQRPLAIVR